MFYLLLLFLKIVVHVKKMKGKQKAITQVLFSSEVFYTNKTCLKEIKRKCLGAAFIHVHLRNAGLWINLMGRATYFHGGILALHSVYTIAFCKGIHAVYFYGIMHLPLYFIVYKTKVYKTYRYH